MSRGWNKFCVNFKSFKDKILKAKLVNYYFKLLELVVTKIVIIYSKNEQFLLIEA